MNEYKIQESIQNRRLIPINKVILILDRITSTMLFIFFTLILWLPLLDQCHNKYSKVGLFAFIVLMSFLLSTYKWRRAMRLNKIVTGKTKSDNIKLINKTIDKNEYHFSYNSVDYIQALGSLNRITVNFIISDNEIFLNVNNYFFRTLWPSLKHTKKILLKFDQNNKAST